MAEAYRRVFLKPAGLSDADAARLEEQLAAAVQLQHRLSARSPHVLQPVGSLQRDEDCFYVEHEPAQPMPTETLFDPGAPFAEEKALLRAAVALFDALRVAHEREDGRAAAHGGLSPAVVLEAENGALKIGDFGVAPAFCSALGPEQYVQLALACDEHSRSEHGATGIWEVLSSEEYERDDRICGYIDPEKFGTQTLASFEPGSDVISAGFILHLLAEHRHPYIDDAEDLRIVELAESMAARLFNGARRKALRESGDPAMQRWCELVATTLARLPRDRPSAASITTSLAEVGVKPMGVEDVLLRRIEQAEELAKTGEWGQVRDLVSGVVANPGAPPDVIARAKALLRQAEAYASLDDAAAQLDQENWTAAKSVLGKLTTSAQMPADLAGDAAKLRTRLDANLKAIELLDGVERTFKEATQGDPAQACALADRLVGDIDALPENDEIGASVRARRQSVRDELIRQRDDLKTKADARAAEFAIVNKWSIELRDAWSQERWSDVGTLLADRPTTAQWPKEVRAEANRIEKLLPQVLDAAAWLEELRAAVELEDARKAQKLLAKKPPLGDWPATLRNDLTELEGRADAARRKVEDAEAAANWIGVVAKAVEKEDWATAQSALVAKPHLQHWPAEVAEREADFRKRIGQQLEARERDRLAIESWLQTAERAAGDQRWEEALRILDAPPLEAKRLPKEVRGELKTRKETYAASLQEARRQAEGKRAAAAEASVRTLLGTVLDKDLRGLLAEEALDIRCGEVAWDSAESPTRGTLSLQVAIAKAPGKADDNTVTDEVGVEVHGSETRIADEGSIRSTLAVRLKKILGETQKQRATDIVTRLREGLFPKAEARIRIDAATDRFAADVALLGGSTPEGRIRIEFAWNPKELLWSPTDPVACAREAVAVAVKASCASLKTKLIEKSDLLRRYAPVLMMDWGEPAVPADGAMPTSLTLDGRLLLKPEGSSEPQLLMPVPVSIKSAGQASLEVDGQSAEVAFLKALLVAQEAARARLERDLQAQAKASPGKPRVAALGKAIKTPVNKTDFEFRPRRGERVRVSGDWDASAFDFALADKTRQTLEAFLEKLPPSSGGVAGKPLFIISGAAAVVVLVIGVSVFRPKSSDAKRSDVATNPNNPVAATTDGGATTAGGGANLKDETPSLAVTAGDNTKPAVNGTGVPAKPIDNPPATPTTNAAPPRTMDQALADVRSLFDGTRLAEFAVQLVSQNGSDAQGAPRATVIFPGLAKSEAELTVTLDLDGARPALSDVDARTVEDGARQVDVLLNNAAGTVRSAIEAETFVGALCDGWINCGAISFDPDTARADWSLDLARGTWSATDIPMRAVVGTDDIVLFDLSLALQVVDGAVLVELSDTGSQVTPSELATSLRATVSEKIVELQNANLMQYRADLTRTGITVTTDPPELSRPLAAVTFVVTSPGLKERRLNLPWSRVIIAFDPDQRTWNAGLARIDEAVETLATLKNAVADPQNWIRRVSDGTPFESSDAGAVDLTFSVPAPWNADLPLPIYSAPYSSRGPGDSEPILPPAYWPIVERYVQLKGTTFGLSQPEAVRGFAADLQTDTSVGPEIKRPVVAYLGTDPPPVHVLPRISIDADAVPGFLPANPLDADPSLLIDVTIRMAVNPQSPANERLTGVNLEALDQAVADLRTERGATSKTCTLAIGLNADDPSKVTWRWSKLGGVAGVIAADVGKLGSLNRLLNEHADRVALERELDGLLAAATGGFVPLDAGDALRLLKRIWTIKGAAPSQTAPQTLDGLSAKLTGSVRFAPKKPRVTPRLRPTVFAEYYTGPQRTFAVVWSASQSGTSGSATVHGRPALVRLGDNASFVNGPPDAADLGLRLIKPVLDRVPDAIAAGPETPFGQRLGIALAFDRRLPIASIADLRIHDWESDLQAANVASAVADFTKWDSLQSLQDSNRAAGYKLLNTLFPPRDWQAPDESQSWAVRALDVALAP